MGVVVETDVTRVHPPPVHVREEAQHPHGEAEVEEPLLFSGEEAAACVLEADEEQGGVVLEGREAPRFRVDQGLHRGCGRGQEVIALEPHEAVVLVGVEVP